MRRLRGGDDRAFEAIFDRYHRELLGFCRHMLGGHEEAEDALQHVMVSAYRHLRADDRALQLRPWLYAIARNRCISVLRARRETLSFDDIAEPSGEGLAVADDVEQRQDLKDVLADIARLPDDQRAALVLTEMGALSHDEVAEALGVRRDKVKALVFQARESLSGWREARGADCHVIREQLANLRGGALRRGPLRRHLETCEGCREFRSDVRRQREAMALLLPVVPSLMLKGKVLGAIAAGAPATVPAAGITAAAVGAAAGTQVAGGSLATIGGGLAAKVLAVAVVGGTAAGGYAVVHDGASSRRVPAVTAPHSTAPASQPRSAPAAGSPTAAAREPGGSTRGKGAASAPGAGRLRKVPGARGFAHALKAPKLSHRPAKVPGRISKPDHAGPIRAGRPSQHGPSAYRAPPAPATHPAPVSPPVAATGGARAPSASGRHVAPRHGRPTSAGDSPSTIQ